MAATMMAEAVGRGAPQVLDRLVRRPRLERLLADEARRRVTLVSAPPASGKTTLLATWFAGLAPGRARWVTAGADEDVDLDAGARRGRRRRPPDPGHRRRPPPRRARRWRRLRGSSGQLPPGLDVVLAGARRPADRAQPAPASLARSGRSAAPTSPSPARRRASCSAGDGLHAAAVGRRPAPCPHRGLGRGPAPHPLRARARCDRGEPGRGRDRGPGRGVGLPPRRGPRARDARAPPLPPADEHHRPADARARRPPRRRPRRRHAAGGPASPRRVRRRPRPRLVPLPRAVRRPAAGPAARRGPDARPRAAPVGRLLVRGPRPARPRPRRTPAPASTGRCSATSSGAGGGRRSWRVRSTRSSSTGCPVAALEADAVLGLLASAEPPTAPLPTGVAGAALADEIAVIARLRACADGDAERRPRAPRPATSRCGRSSVSSTPSSPSPPATSTR